MKAKEIMTSKPEVVTPQDPISRAAQIMRDKDVGLVPVVREYVLLDLPDAPLCKDDCAGICPNCGIDRNTGTCDCETSATDPRWSALEGLQLDDE